MDESTLLGRGHIPHGPVYSTPGMPRLFSSSASALRTPRFDPSLSAIGGGGEGEGAGAGLFTTPNLTPIAPHQFGHVGVGGEGAGAMMTHSRGPARLLQLQTPHLLSPLPPAEQQLQQQGEAVAGNNGGRGGAPRNVSFADSLAGPDRAESARAAANTAAANTRASARQAALRGGLGGNGQQQGVPALASRGGAGVRSGAAAGGAARSVG